MVSSENDLQPTMTMMRSGALIKSRDIECSAEQIEIDLPSLILKAVWHKPVD